MFPAEKRFQYFNNEDSLHSFQTFNNFKKELDSELKRKGIAPNPYIKAPPIKDHVINKKELFNKIQTKFTRVNPNMKLMPFVEAEDRKYIVGESYVEPRLRFEPEVYEEYEDFEQLIQNRSFTHSQQKSANISRDASRISRPYNQSPEAREPLWKPKTAQDRLRKITNEEAGQPPRNIRTAATTSKSSQRENSYLNRSDIGSRKESRMLHDFSTPIESGARKTRILNDSLSESQSQLEIQNDKPPSLADIGPAVNDSMVFAVQNPSRTEIKLPNVSQANLPSNFESLSTAAKFEILYRNFKNPASRGIGSASSSVNRKPNVRMDFVSRAQSAEKRPNKSNSKLKSTSTLKLGEVAENAEMEDNKSISIKNKQRQITFGDGSDSSGEEASTKQKRGVRSVMDPIKNKFNRKVKSVLTKKFELNSKAMKGKIQVAYDRLQRQFDYLELRAHRIKPRNYDFEDYLKTLYGKEITLKDYIAAQIKNNATQKQKDQELVQLTEFLKAQNSMVDPESQYTQQSAGIDQ